ncbi:hypothetical protein P154DRAFT_462617 [Amniculicola lignicola CBS 123094]|uniref:DUF7053 domain-containing protein n=1 Tax=Amniculicola lignicola CBS 123094 TaxID=1392246 RepID=A0A6A5WKS7_9PLEO|nr:hypothetical protein P154DRAFT_462617 [Amniculicola lignicola CBS 123094]
MSKTSVFTTITPLPAGITRQGVMETYHSPEEMIDLNPLVVERFKCKPPSYAPSEEFYSVWYTIKDKVSYLPGNLANGSVSYHAVFHNLPDGLQTHVYAPLGLDIRAKWTVGGSLPGEPKQAEELGLGIPREGLYIREDVKMKCNIMMVSFVKKTFKESHKHLVGRLVEKAHQREAQIANERLNDLRTIKPNERQGHGDIMIAPPPGYNPQQGHMSVYSTGSGNSSMNSPRLSYSTTASSQSTYLGSPSNQSISPDYRMSNNPDQKGDPRVSMQSAHSQNSQASSFLPSSVYNPHQQQQQHHHQQHGVQRAPTYPYHASSAPHQQFDAVELPAEGPQVPPKDNKQFAAELPG